MPPVWSARNFIVRLSLLRERVEDWQRYPFAIPAIAALDELALERPVTFLIGENGTGKSTLLEAIAVGCGLNPEGGSKNFRFSTRASHSALGAHLRLTRSAKRPRDSYFLRAESYFNLATEIENLDREPGGPLIIDSHGGRSLHEQSHGESFFALFMHRFGGNGLYLLDEPEAALSPTRQLAFLARLHELVGTGAQFIIATHSPILMAYPDAVIFQMTPDGPQDIAYTETEHYTVTRNFLLRTGPMLDTLLAPASDPETD